ncbi:MAG: thioredoxin family protein [bacterium]
MNKGVLCLASLLTLAASAAEKPATEGAVPGQWTMDLDAAKKVAAEKKLPLVLNFTGSDWCGWCKHMDKEVFSKDTWTAYAKGNLLLVWIDFPQDKTLVPEKYVARNRALSEFYGVDGYPAYILLDDDGQTQLGKLGADQEISPETFIGSLKQLLKNRAAEVEALLTTLPEKTAQEYRAVAKKKTGAEEELKNLKASFEKKSAELEKVVADQEQRLNDIRLEASLAKLPQKKAETYRTKNARLAAVNAELKVWIATKPERNEINTKKFTAWSEEIAALKKELAALLENK